MDLERSDVLYATEGRDHLRRVLRSAASLAEGYLNRWYRGAIRSRLEPMKDFAHTVGEHWDGVLHWHTTRISNGVLE